MASTFTTDILTGRDAKLFVSMVDVKFSDDKFKTTIYDDKHANDFLFIKKEIGSKINIVDVKIVDDAFINTMLSSKE